MKARSRFERHSGLVCGNELRLFLRCEGQHGVEQQIGDADSDGWSSDLDRLSDEVVKRKHFGEAVFEGECVKQFCLLWNISNKVEALGSSVVA
mmetsp:Transcript_15723/g.29682  ORF Transcript_15723/g.29682 Transcript_15723/m.29682 type:complete len:93 (+) Transcript_15723:1394-1672(+)|eukprot:CAMPEP_0167808722 /NCGR_PEP_ID=MMETSP0111_2-20121227/23367_1 /TAXON_ID=91324 /ORGANISM="Lotharella globosa, Strain CCCM811" /LENGTH=92 /DNA_ID=CAMNT_0007706969 /DNA_START=1374 /DNA_END=1652 /DNA_ORIENTATION=-